MAGKKPVAPKPVKRPMPTQSNKGGAQRGAVRAAAVKKK
jgi:hypothetical protein